MPRDSNGPARLTGCKVEYDMPATKRLDRLDPVTARPVGCGRLKELAFDPYATRISKAVKMEPGQRTSRVGDWRIDLPSE